MHRSAQRVQGRDTEHVGIVEVEHPLVGILLEQSGQNGTGLVAVFRENIAFLDVGGPLAPGERLAIESDVADQVEGIEALAQFLGNEVEVQTFRFEFIDQRLLSIG